MTFNLDKFENVNCDSLEAFRKSLTEWNYRQEEAFEYAKAIFQPLSKLNWDPSNIKPTTKLSKFYCLAQEDAFKDMAERRISAMKNCILFKEKQHKILSNEPEKINISNIAKRDALIMELDIKKQHLMDYEQRLNFRKDCKELTYGQEGKAANCFENVDYTKYEDGKTAMVE